MSIHCSNCEGDIEFPRADNGKYRGECSHCGRTFGSAWNDYSSAVESCLASIRTLRELQTEKDE